MTSKYVRSIKQVMEFNGLNLKEFWQFHSARDCKTKNFRFPLALGEVKCQFSEYVSVVQI